MAGCSQTWGRKPEEEKPAAKPAQSEAKPEEEKPAAKPAQSEAKPDSEKKLTIQDVPAPFKNKPEVKPSAPSSDSSAEEKKPEPAPSAEKKPEKKKTEPAPASEKKPEEKKTEPAPSAEKKPESQKPEYHSVPQFEFRMPTLVVNYGKKPNASFTVGQIPLKAPEQHPMPEPQKPAPARSFKVPEKLHLDVKISTENEAGDAPVISLNIPAKAEQPAAAPARKKPVRKAAPKDFRPAKTRKLQVRVSSASAVETEVPKKKAPRKKAAAPAKKGK